MDTLNLTLHLLNFVAPALVVALLVTVAAPLVLPRASKPRGWWTTLLLNFAAGVAVLVAGLWLFGRDGKIATYLALVAVVATCQWLTGRGWRT